MSLYRNAVLALAAGGLLIGCASAPTPAAAPASADSSCSELAGGIAAAEDAKRSAVEEEQTAWKVVIPLAVAARYAAGKSAADDADKRLKALRKEQVHNACLAG